MEDNKKIVKFYGRAGEDYHLWAARTEAALQAKKAMSVVITDFVDDGESDIADEVREKIADARAIIVQALGDKPLRLCLSETKNPFRMWRKLRERYAVTNLATKVQLQTKLGRMVYKDQPMSDFIDDFEEVFNRLAGMDAEISESMQVAILLASFGEKSSSPYGHVITNIQSQGDAVGWDTVTARLLQEYDEKLWASETPKPSKIKQDPAAALIANGRGSGNGKSKKRSNFRHKLENRRCYNCNEMGHIARYCPKRKQDRDSAFIKTDVSQAHHATLLLASPQSKGNVRLILDSGASDHMVCSATYLFDIEEIPPRGIKLGNGQEVIARSRGKMSLRAKIQEEVPLRQTREKNVVLQHVLCVPSLQTNLISCSALSRERDTVTVEFGHGLFTLLIDGNPIFQGREAGGVYILNAEMIRRENGHALATTATDIETLWHHRLGHANTQSIRDLAAKDAVVGLDLVEPVKGSNAPCVGCIEGKHQKLSLKSSTHRSTRRGEVIHSDVCGPMSKPSLGGSRYFVTFIDEHSGYKIVIPIARKSDVAAEFQKYHVWLERKYDCSIKRLHCDGGGEYVALDPYIQSHGIERGFVPAYYKEQNGLAERANRTLVEAARAMLQHAGMPTKFWAEAVVHAADIRNRFICPRESDRTSFELMTGKKPRVDHLRVFGSLTWTHVPKDRRKKLDSKSEEGVLISCFDNKLYKVWIRTRQAAVISRHVKIFEDQFPPARWYESSEEEAEIPDFSSSLTVKPTRSTAPLLQPTVETPDEMDPISQRDSHIEMLTHVPATPSKFREEEEHEEEQNTEPIVQVQDSEQNNRNADSTLQSHLQPETESRYPRRSHKRTEFYVPGDAHIAVQSPEPTSSAEALSSPQSDHWRKAMDEELASLKSHDTWQVAILPPGKKPIPTRFIFKRKMKNNGTVGKYKARVVVKGFMQGEIDRTYAPVADFTTIRTALAVAVMKGYGIQQMDVKTAFLHGEIDEELYVSPPEGADISIGTGEALRLKKGLYGLKQAPRLWHETWKEKMRKLGFREATADPCVFYRDGVWIILYVDDVILTGTTDEKIAVVKTELSKELDMTDLGDLKDFLGVHFSRDGSSSFMDQELYITTILQKYGMSECKPVSTPSVQISVIQDESESVDTHFYQEVVGSLLYLATRTRPDISSAVNVLCRHFSDPRKVHMTAAKRVLRYLQGTKSFGLRFSGSKPTLEAYSDSDWAGDHEDRKSTSGFVLQLAGSSIMWKTAKQNSTALSSTEAEFIAMSEASKAIVWMRSLLELFHVRPEDTTVLFVDNQGAAIWGKEGIRNAKHVSVRKNFVKELVQSGVIDVVYCKSEHNKADIFTKPLLRVKFRQQRDYVGVVSFLKDGEIKRGT